MKIIVDAFGGDNAPDEIIKGCAEAMDAYGIGIVLTGNREIIKEAAKRLELEAAVSKMEILHCTDTLGMEDEPGSVLKEKRESSMAVGLRALSEGKGDAFASAGNSGALVMGSTMIVKRIKGIKRVTFAPLLPKMEGFFMLSDGGANNECRPVMLQQFAIMAAEYMTRVMGMKNPRVGLINVGEEAHKGDALRLDTYKLLKKTLGINFIGNIEGRDLAFDAADIAITDGFNGNVVLKVYEGVAGAVMDRMKSVFSKSVKNKLAAAAIMGDLRTLKKEMDYNEYGGAPIMGAQKPVFKIHGSAKANTVKNALRLTKAYVESGIADVIADSLIKTKNAGGDHEAD